MTSQETHRNSYYNEESEEGELIMSSSLFTILISTLFSRYQSKIFKNSKHWYLNKHKFVQKVAKKIVLLISFVFSANVSFLH